MKRTDNLEFKIEQQKNKSAKKINPFYSLIEGNSIETSKIIGNHSIEKMDSCDAYLINFTTTDDELENIFITEGYIFDSRHLRIDATYVSNKYGFSPIHYTEIYLNASINNKIVVHTYFNTAGKYLYTEAKCKNVNSGLTEQQDISDQSRKIILNNFGSIFELLNNLVMHKNEIYQKELKNSYTLDEELSRLYKLINTENGLTNYINKANEFINSINKINALNEIYIDTRARSVRNLITHFLNKKFEPLSIQDDNDAEKVEEVVEEVAEEEITQVIYLSPQQENRQHAQKKPNNFLEQSNLYINKLNTLTNNKDMIDYNELDQLIFEAQLIELSFYDLSNREKNSKGFKAAVNNLEEAIRGTKEFIENKLIKSIHAGDLGILKNVFQFSQHYLTIDICLDVLNKLIDIDKKTDSLIEVCDFLNSKSDIFKTAIIIFASHYQGKNNDILLSKMLTIYREGNLSLFKKLIEYGAPCRIGMYDSKNNRRLPLLNAIVLFESGKKTYNFDYIDELLDNTYYTFISGKNLSKNSYLTKITPACINSKKIQQTKSNLAVVFDNIYELTPLEIAVDCYQDKISSDLIDKLIPYSSLESLALSAVWFNTSTWTKGINSIIPSNKKNGIYLCDANKQAKMRDKYENLENVDRLLYLIAIAEDVPVPDNFKISMNTAYLALQNKIAQLPNLNNNINAIIKNLSNEANNQIITKQNYKAYKYTQYNACLFLLAQKGKLSLADTKIALDLLKNIAKVYYNYSTKPELECALFTNAYNFICNNKFKNELENARRATCKFITNRYNTLLEAHKPKLLLSIALASKKNDGAKLYEHISHAFYPCLPINDWISESTKQTLLHYACDSGSKYLECAQILILLGADINCRDASNRTPLELIPDGLEIKDQLKNLSILYKMLIEQEKISVKYVTYLLQQNIFNLPKITALLFSQTVDPQKKYRLSF